MRMRPSVRLIRLLKPPSQVANTLDWAKKTKNVATLHIGRDRIGVAIASHPEVSGAVQVLPPVKLQLVTKEGNQRALAPTCVDTLASVCEEHEVGSFVVVWPAQKSGRAGASCGKVLHTLESLLSESDSVLTKNRPICLWTGGDEASKSKEYLKHAEDEWGRCAVYSRSNSKKTIHRASQEQYCFPKGCSHAAVDAWEAFCREYWPDIHAERERYAAATADAAKVRQAETLRSENFSMSSSHQHQLSMQFA